MREKSLMTSSYVRGGVTFNSYDTIPFRQEIKASAVQRLQRI